MNRRLDSADKIDNSVKKYFQSEKGKTALARTQKKYYQNKKKPERDLVKIYCIWAEANPGQTVDDFLKEATNGNR